MNSGASDLDEIKKLLDANEYSGLQAKLATLEFGVSVSKDPDVLDSNLNFAKAHLYLAQGDFERVSEVTNNELRKIKTKSCALLPIDLQRLLRIKAQKHFILNENELLKDCEEQSELIDKASDIEELHYLTNSIKAMNYSAQGEHRKSLNLCEINIKIADDSNFRGYKTPIDVYYVKCISLMAMSDFESAFNSLKTTTELAKNGQNWPWYFLANGQQARQLATDNKLEEALQVIREERDLIATFKFKNLLWILTDANELYIRSIIRDLERIDVLMKRLPDLTLVKHIRAARQEWTGRDMLAWIHELPTDTAREEIYKLSALSEYHKGQLSKSVEYMSQLLPIIERTGSTEFLIRQHKLFDVIVKAIHLNPTPYLEEVLSRISERVAIHAAHTPGGLIEPLTKREMEILIHLATGITIRSIGESLSLSMNTIKTHVKNIYRKLEVDNRERAIERAKSIYLI